jgi:hypothetical protein
MKHPDASTTHKIDKKYITALTIFAINNIPDIDEFTLKKFLELMNTTGSFGTITDEQLIEVMSLIMKYVPGTCIHSLCVLVDLLGIYSLPLKGKCQADFRLASQSQPKLIDSGSAAKSSQPV